MKNFILPILFIGLALASCRKEANKKTLYIDSDRASVEVNRDDIERHLLAWTDNNLFEKYDIFLENKLDQSRVRVVDDRRSADIVLTIDNFLIQEQMEWKQRGGEDFHVSTLGLSVNYTLTAGREDVPQYYNSWLETHDCIVADTLECGTKYYYLTYTSIEEIIEGNTGRVEKKVNRYVRKNF